MEYVIETKNLSKKFKTKLAANNVNMHIEKGSIYGFIGKNGAGKTTVMKLILGLLRPSGGEITINGTDELNKERAKIGSLIEDPGIYKNCTAFENMKRYAILFNTSDEEIKELLKLVDLDKTGKKVAGQFSLGMKQRLGIAISMLGHPEILILDEPINGLDPAGIKEVRDTIIRLNKEKGITFLISSHLLDELAKITTHYGIIRDGVLLEEISAKELMDRCVTNMKIVVDDPVGASKLLETKKLINKYEIKGKTIYLYDSLDHPELIVDALVRDEFKVYEISKNESAFENYFIERIGR